MRLALVMLAAFLLAACGQSEQPAKNEADHPGPAGTPARINTGRLYRPPICATEVTRHVAGDRVDEHHLGS